VQSCKSLELCECGSSTTDPTADKVLTITHDRCISQRFSIQFLVYRFMALISTPLVFASSEMTGGTGCGDLNAERCRSTKYDGNYYVMCRSLFSNKKRLN